MRQIILILIYFFIEITQGNGKEYNIDNPFNLCFVTLGIEK